MKTFLTLLKVDLLTSLSLNNIGKKGKKQVKTNKKSSGTKGIVFFIVLMFVIFSFYAYGFLQMSIGYVNELVLYYGISLGAMMSLIFTFTNAQAVLFKSKDYELLMALPINKRTIIASKLTSVSLLGYLYFGFCYLPSWILYMIFIDFSFQTFLFGLLVFLLIPLVILTIGAFLSLLIGLATAKLKNKNFINSIAYAIILLVIMFFSFKMGYGSPESDTEAELLTYYTSIRDSLERINPLSKFAVETITGNLLSFVYLLAISLIPYSIFLFVCSINYERLNALGKEGYKNKNFKLKEEKQKSPMKTLIHKEFKNFISVPAYFTNVILSPIMGAIVIAGGSIFVKNKYNDLFGTADLELIRIMVPMVLLAVSSWCFGISPATSVSINMEGKTFWVIKSMPVETKTILWSKILFNMILYIPFILISSIVAIIFLDINILDAICLLLSPIAFTLCFSFVGLLLNTKFYNITWDNPTQAVKQGAGLLLSMLIDMGISFLIIIPIVIGYFLNVSLCLVILLMGCLAAFLFGLLCMKKGAKNFNNISV